ncbi:class GN sortase [Ostreibacterium oceani]|uniref:Class GN sortase n=1 Tax=Ostreibacterium oceani TaxID=2654998 RepID=A0A6N7EUZ8_9GAMM|nr:class GN sortase [Ostreibacterium oceani]MPV85435.1 class GN sortase [Ostreibacterium oceani]
MKRRKIFVLAVFVIMGMSQLGSGLYTQAKAQVANWLISESWQERNHHEAPQKPWPWADTWVVARLSVPRLGINQFVMQDVSGESLAFGPGATDNIRTNGYNILAGHRDTHFNYLDELQVGDYLEIENISGETIIYQMTTSQVIDVRDGPLRFDANRTGLSLITCWPMDAIVPGGPLRYVVSGQQVSSISQVTPLLSYSR